MSCVVCYCTELVLCLCIILISDLEDSYESGGIVTPEPLGEITGNIPNPDQQPNLEMKQEVNDDTTTTTTQILVTNDDKNDNEDDSEVCNTYILDMCITIVCSHISLY